MNSLSVIGARIGANVLRWLGGWGRRKAVQWEAEIRKARLIGKAACDWCGAVAHKDDMYFVGGELICRRCAEQYGNKLAGKEVAL